jgi:hypothetical protein
MYNQPIYKTDERNYLGSTLENTGEWSKQMAKIIVRGSIHKCLATTTGKSRDFIKCYKMLNESIIMYVVDMCGLD